MSLFVWYFGTRGQYPDVDHHTIVLGPRYRGLLDDIFDAKRLAPDMSLYLHRPTATDPLLAPPGCDGFYVLSPVPHLDAGIDWTTQAEPYRQAVERRLSETVLPGSGGADRHLPRDDADRFQRALLFGQGRRIQPRPDLDAERVVSTQQPE